MRSRRVMGSVPPVLTPNCGSYAEGNPKSPCATSLLFAALAALCSLAVHRAPMTRSHRYGGGVANVDIDGNNILQIKAIGVFISTFETLPGLDIKRLFPKMLHRSRPSWKACKNNLLRKNWSITTLESNKSHSSL